MERGVIRNRTIGKQLRDFSSLQFERGITPTDIDGFVEFGDKVFVFIEAKYNGANLSLGQRLALERLVDAVCSGGKSALLILCSHNNTPEEDVDIGNCPVSEYRVRKRWHRPKGVITVRCLIDMYKTHVLKGESNG